MLEKTKTEDATAENILDCLSDFQSYPQERLAPYEEFSEAGETYYFTPGGFLYRKDFLTEQLGGYFCGYLTDEVWHYRTDNHEVIN